LKLLLGISGISERYENLGGQKLAKILLRLPRSQSKFRTSKTKAQQKAKARQHGISLFSIIKKKQSAELPPPKNL